MNGLEEYAFKIQTLKQLTRLAIGYPFPQQRKTRTSLEDV
jgi:hypothetical protein